MTQLDIVKAFLQDTAIQEKYGLTPADIDQMTMQSQYTAKAQTLINLIRRMVAEVEDQSKTVNVVASVLNQTLETTLR
jgi:predicted RNA-binding protein with PIN domain